MKNNPETVAPKMSMDPEYEMNFVRKSENMRRLYAYSAQQATNDKPSVLREISFISIDASTESGHAPEKDSSPKTKIAVTIENMEMSTVVEDSDQRHVQSLRGSRKTKRFLDHRRKTECGVQRNSSVTHSADERAEDKVYSNSSLKTISFQVPKLKINSKNVSKSVKKSPLNWF